jgi:DNA repair protein RadC
MRDHRKGDLAKVALQERHAAPLNPSPLCRGLSLTSCPSTVEEEVLTALLAYSDGVVPAHLLLRRFKSIGHAVAADESQLEKLGLSRRDINLLRLVHATARLLAAGAVRDRPMVGNWQALLDYLQTSMAYEPVEQLRMLFLDCRNHLIADEVLQRGTINHTPVYPREVVKRALLLNASALIAVHNHPSGDPTPSRGDIEMTRELKRAAAALDLELHDHVVIGHGKHASFRSLGLL